MIYTTQHDFTLAIDQSALGDDKYYNNQFNAVVAGTSYATNNVTDNETDDTNAKDDIVYIYLYLENGLNIIDIYISKDTDLDKSQTIVKLNTITVMKVNEITTNTTVLDSTVNLD